MEMYSDKKTPNKPVKDFNKEIFIPGKRLSV